jgi:hypothetical protein
VKKTPIFGQFSGQVGAERDTTKRRGDTKDRCGGGRRQTQESRNDRGRDETRGDRDLVDGRD